MTYIAKTNREKLKKVQFQDVTERGRMKILEYPLTSSDYEFQIGDVVYLVDENRKRFVFKSTILDVKEDVLTLLFLITISTKSTFEFEGQIVSINDATAKYIKEHIDNLYHNGFHIYAVQYMREHNINLIP